MPGQSRGGRRGVAAAVRAVDWFGCGVATLVDLDGDHDGTVLVAETQLPGAKDHIVLHTSHTAMLFSTEVARQIVTFLREGKFQRRPPDGRDGSG